LLYGYEEEYTTSTKGIGMIKHLYDQLSKMGLKYHELHAPSEGKLFLKGISLLPEGIEEAIRIKSMADQYKLDAIWDGENIEISPKVSL